MSRYGGWPGGIHWDDSDNDRDHRDYERGPFIYNNNYRANNPSRPRPNQEDRGGRGNDGRDNHRQGGYRPIYDHRGYGHDYGDNHWLGGYRLGGGRIRYGNGYRDLPDYLRRLNLNRGLQGGAQLPDQWQFGGPPVPRQPVPRPDTPEPNAPTVPRPPSRPVSPRPSTPEPRPNPSGGEDGDDCFAPWVIRLDTDQHKCVDEGLFRQPFSPDPIIMEDDSIFQPQGTVVLPIKPGRRYNMDRSVMTVSNALYTPMASESELSFPVLAEQGFTLHETRRPSDSILRGLHRAFAKGRFYTLQHSNLPGVYLLYTCLLDGDTNRLSVMPKLKVNKRKWIEGVQSGVLGRAVDMGGTLGWTEASEHSRFEEIVLDPDRRRAGIDRIPGEDDITTVLH